jgi:hypothetical protein
MQECPVYELASELLSKAVRDPLNGATQAQAGFQMADIEASCTMIKNLAFFQRCG